MRYRLLIIFSIFCFVEAMAQNGQQQWAEPQIPAEWGLERMPHNNANPNVYVYKDKRYDALFTRTLGWNGGDGVQTTLLPGGNVFWSFNDSFYGRATDALSRIRRSSNFPRNSLMVQTPGEDGQPGAENTNLVWLADWVQREVSNCWLIPAETGGWSGYDIGAEAIS